MYDAHFFPLPGHDVFDREKQQIAAVSRAPGNIDLFVIGFDNRVWSTWWNEQLGGWGDYPDGHYFPLPGQAVFDREKQQIAAVSRAPGNIDLFVIGFDNRIWSTYWNEVGGWSGDWFPLPGHDVFDREKQQIAAVSRAPGNIDLFVIGFDNRVWSTWWNEQLGGWGDYPDGHYFPLPGHDVFDREKQQIAAVSRAPGNIDLFVIGFDNRIWSTWWNEQLGGWGDYPDGHYFPLPGHDVFDREKQQIAAVSRAPGNIDLFVIGFDNRVWSTWWNEQLGGWGDYPDGHYFPLPGHDVFDREKQQVAAVSRAPGNIDVFVIGFDNRVWSTWWNEQLGGWGDYPDGHYFPLPGHDVFDREKQQVAAVSRAPGNLDVFMLGFDNRVWTTYWNEQSGWDVGIARLIDNGPLGAKVTMVVVGDGFTLADQDNYNSAVDSLLVSGMFTHDFFATQKRAFNLIRINVVSNESGVSTKTYDADGKVTASTTHDTYFGAVFNGDWANCWVEDGPQTAPRLNELLARWVPDPQLVFLLLNNPGFGGCGGDGRLTTPLGVSWSTLAHECGHALGGLADEYHERADAYTGDEPGEPNVTVNTNRATLKWAWAVNAATPLPTGGDDYTPPKPAGWDDNQSVGLFEGGRSNFATGIYRPVINCRMNSNEPAFCPVCNAAMSALTAPFLGVAPAGAREAVAAPRVGGSGGSYVRLLVRLANDQLSVVDAREVEGPLVQPQTLTHGLVHEVLVGGERVAMGAQPDAGVSRSFTEPGHGPSEHHISELDTIEFPVRVPTEALRGTDPATVDINVVDVHTHQHEAPAGVASLHEHSTVDSTPRASLTLGGVALPEVLRSIMAD